MTFLAKIKDKILKEIIGKTQWFWAVILASITIDYLNTLYFNKIQKFFFNIFERKDEKAILFIIGVYVLLIIAIIFTNLMTSYKTPRIRKNKQIVEFFYILMIIGFGIILMMPSINILGMAEDKSNFTDNQQYTYLMIMVGLIFAILIIPFISFKPKYHFGNFNYFIVYIPLIIIVSLLIDFSSAIWKFSLLDPSKLVDPERSSRLIEFIALFPLYALFFAAPRFVLVRKSMSVFTFISALATIMYFVWKSLEFIEL